MSALEIAARESVGARKLSVVADPEFRSARSCSVAAVPQANKPQVDSSRGIASPREIVRPDRPDSRKQRYLRVVPNNPVAWIAPVSREWKTVDASAARAVAARPTVRTAADPHSTLNRILWGALVLAAMFAVFMLAMAFTVGLGGGVPIETVVQVQPGDSLWSIAATFSGDSSVSETAKNIADLNSLANGQVIAGQDLLIPAN